MTLTAPSAKPRRARVASSRFASAVAVAGKSFSTLSLRSRFERQDGGPLPNTRGRRYIKAPQLRHPQGGASAGSGWQVSDAPVAGLLAGIEDVDEALAAADVQALALGIVEDVVRVADAFDIQQRDRASLSHHHEGWN